MRPLTETVEALVERTEKVYERRFKEGEHATQLEGCREALQGILRELEALLLASAATPPLLRGKAAYIRGMSEALLEGFASPGAKAKLAAAAKLAPRLPGPWNCLAHCYWTTGELGLAQQCFERGLAGSPNKEGLRQRSILRRHAASLDQHAPGNKDEDIRTSQLSIEDARRAVQLDCEDGYSWYVLGTAHLMASFKNHNPMDLRQALAGYAQAEKLGVTLPDLFYNRAILQQYQQRHQQAIADFRRAGELDEELPALAQMQASLSVLNALRRAVQSVRSLSERKLSAAVHALKKGMEGPRHRPEGCPPGEALSRLREGPNDGTALLCRAMLPVEAGRSSASAANFVALDEDQQVFASVVLGLQPGTILQGHNLLLLSPEVEPAEVEGLRFRVARISDPSKVWVDGTMSFRPTSADVAVAVAISASYAGS